MALEIENNLVAGLRYDGANALILSQFGIASVVKSGAGVYQVTTIEGLAGSEAASACSLEPPNPGAPVDSYLNHQQLTATTHQLVARVLPGDTPTDTIVTFKLYRNHTAGY